MKMQQRLFDMTLLGIAGLALLLIGLFPLAFGLELMGSSDEAAAENAEETAFVQVIPTRTAADIDAIMASELPVSLVDAASDIQESPYAMNIVDHGREDYLALCAACHGTDGAGVAGIGKTLVQSEFVREHTDQELLEFVIAGRTIWDPENTTGVAMPARGGNSLLSDQEIANIVAYLRVEDDFFPSNNDIPEFESVAADTDTDASDESQEPVVFTPIDISSLTGDSDDADESDTATVDTAAGEAAFAALCDTMDEASCEFLMTIEDADRLRDLLINGTSPFDSSIPEGIVVPQRGGMLLFSDSTVDEIVNFLLPPPVDAATTDATDADTDSAAPNAETAAGEAAFAALCDTMDEASCQFLMTIEDADRLRDLLINGTSPFDSSIPEGIVVPQRGGMLLFSDSTVDEIVKFLLAPPSETSSTDATDSNIEVSLGATVYAEMCIGTDNAEAMCDYLLSLAENGESRERILDLVINGSSPFDSSIPQGISIPQRGGPLLLSQEEIEAFVDYLFDQITEEFSWHQSLSYVGRLKGSVIYPHRSIPDFSVPSTKGTDFVFSEHRGETILVYFGYLTCPDVCPATLVDMMRAYREVGEPAEDVKVVFITIDPERDSLDIMQRYIESFHSDFIGLRPESPEQLQALIDAFGILIERREVDSALAYLMDHSAAVYLMGPDGRVVSQLPYGVHFSEIANDMAVMVNYTFPDQPDPDTLTNGVYILETDPEREYRITIPPGTFSQIQAGNDPGIIPLKIELTIGAQDILVLENNDEVDYLIGGIWVAPHETVIKQFYEPQSFVGLCTVTVGRDLIEIVVSEPAS